MTIDTGWQLQDAAKVPEGGGAIATAKYKPQGWYAATVPGTVLTSLVNDGVYPEPLYGENNRPDKIPDSLSRDAVLVPDGLQCSEGRMRENMCG